MTRQRHYHPLAALRFLRKAVVVCLLPLANALLEFSLNALPVSYTHLRAHET